MLLAVALAIVVGYLVLSINVYLETITREEFHLGYGLFGPTEARALLIGLNTVALLVGPAPFVVLGIGMTAFDVAGILGAAAMGGLLARRIMRNIQHLGSLEPAARPKQRGRHENEREEKEP